MLWQLCQRALRDRQYAGGTLRERLHSVLDVCRGHQGRLGVHVVREHRELFQLCRWSVPPGDDFYGDRVHCMLDMCSWETRFLCVYAVHRHWRVHKLRCGPVSERSQFHGHKLHWLCRRDVLPGQCEQLFRVRRRAVFRQRRT